MTFSMAFFRIADAAILAVVTLNGLVSVRLLSGADYVKAIDAQQLQRSGGQPPTKFFGSVHRRGAAASPQIGSHAQ